VMGFAGAGGIGREIDVSLRLLEPARTATLLFALVGMVLAVDAAVHLIERKLPVPPPRWLHLVWLILLPLALQQGGFIGILAPDLLPRFGALAVQVVPPDVSSLFVISLGEPAWHTVAISVVGTAIGVGLGTALARLRPVLAVLRAVPPLVWVALCVLAAGRGPLAGALALGLHGAGLPLRAPRLRSTLLRWRDNLAVASVVGITGGGGIGAALANTVRLAFYDRTTSIVMVIVVLVSTVDALVDAWPAGSPHAATPLVVPIQAAPEK
jgi:phosphonate transport system permease protein